MVVALFKTVLFPQIASGLFIRHDLSLRLTTLKTIVSFTVYASFQHNFVGFFVSGAISLVCTGCILCSLFCKQLFYFFSRMVMHEGYPYHAGIGLCIVTHRAHLKTICIMRKYPPHWFPLYRGFTARHWLYRLSLKQWTLFRLEEWYYHIFKDVTMPQTRSHCTVMPAQGRIDLADTKEIVGLKYSLVGKQLITILSLL